VKIDKNVNVEFNLVWRVAGKYIAYALNYFKIPVYGLTITINKESKPEDK